MTSDFYENEQINEQEKQIGSKQAFTRLLPSLKEHKKALWTCLILLAAATIISLYWPILLRHALDVDIVNADFKGLIVTVVAIGMIQVISIALQYVMRVKLEIIGQDVMLTLKRKLFNHILSLDVDYFDKNPVGRLIARVESDTESLRLLFTNSVVMIVGDTLLIIGIYSVLFYVNWRLALILFTTVPIIGFLVWIFHKKTTPKFFEVRRKMAEITAALTELIHGMSIIQIFHQGTFARKRVYEVNRLKFNDDAYVNVAVILFFNTVFFFEYVKIGLVLLVGPLLGISFGTIIMFIIFIWRSFEPIWRTSEQLSNFQKAIAGSKRIYALLAQKSKLVESVNPVRWSKLEKSIIFDNVSFSYTGDDNYVLKNVSFEIPKGKRVALVGVTGGGKTTVISLMLRFYDPQKGKISVDGIDVRDISLAELRTHFALVLQDIILFPGDIRFNISLDSDNISEDAVVRATKTVEADRFIRKLSQDYKTVISEKGSNFSRGERQLLSFARALAIDPDILILDEATSSVDPETERTIQNSLKKLMVNRTSLIIAHRLTTILDVDQILVIKHGEIIERGTHTELLLQNGYYSKLFHLQFKNRNGVLSNVK